MPWGGSFGEIVVVKCAWSLSGRNTSLPSNTVSLCRSAGISSVKSISLSVEAKPELAKNSTGGVLWHFTHNSCVPRQIELPSFKNTLPVIRLSLTMSHSKNHHRAAEFAESECVNFQRTLRLCGESDIVKFESLLSGRKTGLRPVFSPGCGNTAPPGPSRHIPPTGIPAGFLSNAGQSRR